MASGDEPQLGGKSQDNAPMISSIVTKVIADARGAYLTDNLQALWERMTETQQLRFHKELVRQSLWYAEKLLPPETEFQAQRACIDAAKDWLNDNSEQATARMRDASREVSEIARANDREARRIKSVSDACDVALYMSFVVGGTVLKTVGNEARWLAGMLSQRGDIVDKDMERIDAVNGAKRWQVESAWAILNGRELPALRPDDPYGPYAAYWYHRVRQLIEFMDEEQQLAFRQAVVRQVLWYTEQVEPPEAEDQGERECLEAARRWLDDPTTEHAEAAHQQYWENRLRAQEGPPSLKAAVHTAWTVSAEIYTTMGMAASLATSPAIQHLPQRFPDLEVAHAITRLWRREAAWAILNGKELPPMEHRDFNSEAAE